MHLGTALLTLTVITVESFTEGNVFFLMNFTTLSGLSLFLKEISHVKISH